jgi:hypothetical protein
VRGDRGRRRPAAALLCALAAAGCEPDHPVPPEGWYAYVGSYAVPGTADSVVIEGALEITEASAGELEGRWRADRLHPELTGGEWVESAYEIKATPTFFGTLVHRVAPQAAGDGFRCEGEFTWVAEGGIERAVPVRCSLVFTDQIPPGATAPVNPRVIRPAEP